jgi:hypothetical protein
VAHEALHHPRPLALGGGGNFRGICGSVVGLDLEAWRVFGEEEGEAIGASRPFAGGGDFEKELVLH